VQAAPSTCTQTPAPPRLPSGTLTAPIPHLEATVSCQPLVLDGRGEPGCARVGGCAGVRGSAPATELAGCVAQPPRPPAPSPPQPAHRHRIGLLNQPLCVLLLKTLDLRLRCLGEWVVTGAGAGAGAWLHQGSPRCASTQAHGQGAGSTQTHHQSCLAALEARDGPVAARELVLLCEGHPSCTHLFYRRWCKATVRVWGAGVGGTCRF